MKRENKKNKGKSWEICNPKGFNSNKSTRLLASLELPSSKEFSSTSESHKIEAYWERELTYLELGGNDAFVDESAVAFVVDAELLPVFPLPAVPLLPLPPALGAEEDAPAFDDDAKWMNSMRWYMNKIVYFDEKCVFLEIKCLPLGLCGAVDVDPVADAPSPTLPSLCECRGFKLAFKLGWMANSEYQMRFYLSVFVCNKRFIKKLDFLSVKKKRTGFCEIEKWRQLFSIWKLWIWFA